MPIYGASSYPTVMSQFVQHWTDVNTALGAALVLSGSRTVGMFSGWLSQVETKLVETTAATMAAALRKGELDVMKANLIEWTVIFNQTVRVDHGGLSLAKRLVPAPGQSDGRGVFIEPVAKSQQIWADLNSATGLDVEIKRRRTLPNGTIATETLGSDAYGELLNDLQAKWNEWDRARQKADNVREERNDVLKLAYEAMRDYRGKVPLELPADHALVDSLPQLNPDPAQRPDPPSGQGVWNAVTSQADLSGAPSPSATVVRTDLRWSPEPAGYNEENEVILTSLPVGTDLTFSTDLGLAVAGDVSRFTWVAVTEDGNEGRSNVMEVTRE